MSRMSGKFDWPEIELEYISGGDDLSIRALATKHEGAFSHFAAKARDGGWDQKRKDYRTKMLQKTVDEITSTVSVKIAKIKGLSLDVIEAAIMKMGLDMQDRWVEDPLSPNTRVFIAGQTVTPDHVVKLIDRLLLLSGNPTTISESRNLGIDLTDNLPPDVARVLAEVAGERGSDTGSVGRSALPSARPARTN